jgi:hypothetical protein
MADYVLNISINGAEQSVQTIGQLEQALKATNDQLSKVDKNSQEFSQLTNQAKTLETALVGVSQDAKTMDTSLKGAANSAKTLNTNLSATAQAANSVEAAGTSAMMVGQGLAEASTSAQSLRKQLREIVQELQNLEPGSARFQELSERAGQLRDTIADTNQVTAALAGSGVERLGRALQSTAQLGIAGFQAVTAAQTLFGSESEAINQSLLKMTALLNLSQAIETFGGLGDKLTTITAGFKSLFPAVTASATATGAMATATAAEGTAAAGATVATSAWAVALNALPLVAIVTALGLLVAGLINYAAGSDEAKKAEEERKKKLEEEKQAIDAVVDSNAKEGSGLIILLSRLKATNAGSKERAALINEINSNYGVGLKNLKDEEKFQGQVTNSVKEYLVQLKNKIAAQLVEAQIIELIKKRLANEQELAGVQKSITANSILYNANLGQQFNTTQLILNQQGIYSDGIFKQTQYIRDGISAENTRAQQQLNASNARKSQIESENAAIQDQIDKLGIEAQNYASLLTGVFDKTTNATKGTGKSFDDVQQKQQDALNNIQDFIQKATDAEQNLEKDRLQRTSSRIDDIEYEKDITLSTIIQEYTAQKKAIEDNVKDEKKRTEALQVLAINYNKFIEAETLRSDEKLAEIKKAAFEKERKYLEDLLLGQKILNEEITFGNNNVSDLLIDLDRRKQQLKVDELDREIQFNELSLDDLKKKNAERLVEAQKLAELEKQVTIAKAKAERLAQETEILNYYKKVEDEVSGLAKYEISVNEETGKISVELNKQYEEEKAKDGKVALDNAYAEAVLVEDNLNKTKLNLNEETNTKILEADSQYNTKYVQNQKDAEDEILKYRIDLIDKYIGLANESLSVFNQGQLSGFSSLISSTLTGISDLLNLKEQEFANFSDKLASYATAIGSAILGVINGFMEANKAQLDAALQVIEIETNAEKDAITSTYNTAIEAKKAEYEQNLITQQQYNDAVQTLTKQLSTDIAAQDKSLNDRQLVEKKKAFKQEQNLKIAQTVISGLQGAVQAFAGAMSLGPIAGPIVGAILAAAVGGLAAANIAQIKKVQFNSGQTISASDTTIPDTGGAVAASNLPTPGGFTTFSEGAMGGPGGGFVPNTPFGTTSPQKVYVLESDITAAQSRVRVLEENSTFG